MGKDQGIDQYIQDQIWQIKQVMGLCAFIYLFYQFVPKTGEKNKNKLKELAALNRPLEDIVAFAAMWRSFLAAGSALRRSTMFYKEVTKGSTENFRMEGHYEGLLALTSVAYLVGIGIDLYLGKKDAIDRNKFIFELVEFSTNAVVGIMRLPGVVFPKLDASTWSGLTEEVVLGCMLGGYAIELINQFIYDMILLQNIENKITELHRKIQVLTAQPAEFRTSEQCLQLQECQTQMTNLLVEKSDAWINIIMDIVHLSSMVIGIALTLASMTPAGLALTITATAGHQFKQLIMACRIYSQTKTKCDEQTKHLDNIENIDWADAIAAHNANIELIKRGLPEYKGRTEDFETYKKEQRQTIKITLYRAEQELKNNLAWFGIMIVTISLTPVSAPLGLGVFVVGLASYGLVRAFYLDKQPATSLTNKPNLNAGGAITPNLAPPVSSCSKNLGNR